MRWLNESIYIYIRRLVNTLFWHWLIKTTYSRSTRVMWKRTKLYGRFLKKMGQSCKIKGGCIIEYPENICIGDGVSVQYHCFLSGYGGLTIGSDVSLGNHTKIFTSEHPYSGNGRAFKYNELERCPVMIGSNVITGADVIILGGVHIGDNVMIGAGSVVTKDIPSNSVWAGNPAKWIKDI